MTTLLELSTEATRSWVRWYCRRLPEDERIRRIAEIDSDLWEQQADGRGHARAEADIGFDVLVRLVTGIPADILWRRGRRSGARRSIAAGTGYGRAVMKLVQKVVFVGAALVALFTLVNAVGSAAGVMHSGEIGWWDVSFIVPQIVGSLAVMVGLWLLRTRPRHGAVAVAAGAVLVAGSMFWIAAVTVPIAALVLWAAVSYARAASTGVKPA